MGTLSVWGFSCLSDVSFETRPVVAIIGPQGSGKSVMTKLHYFVADILSDHVAAAERGETFEEFKRSLANKFRNWFPPAAWGGKRFNINYSSGDFNVRILRRYKSGKVSDELAFSFSDWFEEFYNSSRQSFTRIKERALSDEIALDENSRLTDPFEQSFRMRGELRLRLARRLGADFIDSQTFIPAGRAFFTSIGKLVAAFRNLGALDPLTIEFAERFSSLRARNSSLRLASRFRNLGPEFHARDRLYRERFFGGEIVYQADSEHIRSGDGRQIPFTALSSGQQEVLPMWAMVQYLAEMDAWRFRSEGTGLKRNRHSRKEVLYIEEPEAHLFPVAQSDFLRYLFESLSFSNRSRNLIITTHSPYIIGRLSVFLKAGALSKRKKKNTDINEVIPRQCWIRPEDFAAYAMTDGRLVGIVDSDGIIESTYIDSISRDISDDFDRLLDIEMSI